MGDTASRNFLRISLAAGMALFCGVCGRRTARLALAPATDSAEYHFRLWQAQTDPAPLELDRALALNPRFSEAWIARGLEAEARGDRGTAEASFKSAAGIDRTVLPRWTLANFYLRAGDTPRFWIWARRTAEMTSDPTALFQLCWRVSGDAGEILDRAIPLGPETPGRDIRRAYLNFLIRTNRLEAAEPLADELSRAAGASDADLLLSYCDLALAHKQVRPALAVWNALAQRRLISFGGSGALTNSDFSNAPLGRGFDWRPGRVEGASLSFHPASGEMSATLSGRQPESFLLIEQYVAVEPGTAYNFTFRYRTRDLTAVNGLRWGVMDERTGAELAAVEASASSEEYRERNLEFSTPRECALARLVLRYRRTSGSVRAEGVAIFGRLSLKRQENQKAKGKGQKSKMIRPAESARQKS
jgi:tetratricopeptide (TPR) repeat protein